MEHLITSQRTLYMRIARTWDNVKKAGTAKITIDYVRTTLGLLDDKWRAFESQHNALLKEHAEALLKSEYWQEDLMGQAEIAYTQQRSHLMGVERKLLDEAPAAAPAKPDAGVQNVQFPRIDLPIFSGRFEDWPAFRDLFRSMVVDEPHLPKVRKLHYLKTSVTGDAGSLLKNLPSTADNFERAWATLEEHYDNKRLLVRSYLTAFTDLQKMRPRSTQDLRQIFHGALNTLSAMEGIGRPIFEGEDLFVHLVVNLLDADTRREWDRTLRRSVEPPAFDDLQAFLKEQLTSEEALKQRNEQLSDHNNGAKHTSTRAPTATRRAPVVRAVQAQSGQRDPDGSCPLCKGPHFVINCERYLKKNPQERKEVATQHSRCFNCFGRHQVGTCQSNKNCRKCFGRHHSSLHEAFITSSQTPATADSSATVRAASEGPTARGSLLLSTARVWVKDRVGREHAVRVLMDRGADVSLASESLAQRLRLPRSSDAFGVRDVMGQYLGAARGRVTLVIAAHDKKAEIKVSALVLPRLAAYNGLAIANDSPLLHLQGLKLADPDWRNNDPVEIVLGADVCALIALAGSRFGGPQEPIAEESLLGWVLLGRLGADRYAPVVTSRRCSCDEDLSAAVSRLWEWEEPVPMALPLTEEEKGCEEYFLRTHMRLPDGRFRVRLPFRTSQPTLPETRTIALRQLGSLRRRFLRDSEYHELYEGFMREYRELQHMSPAPLVPAGAPCCYLPHHGVVKNTNQGKKLRVVFNGSARTSACTSLNTSLLTGPNLVPSLSEVVLRWRCHRFAFVADIEKMYRQIDVHPDDRDTQRILWLEDGKIKDFKLNTVTYGTACAPFLALRVLQQLAIEEQHRYPAGAAAIQRGTYVDDILWGASSVEEGRRAQEEITALCMAGGFPLRKWAANEMAILALVPAAHRQGGEDFANLPSAEHSVLGLRWCPEDDSMTVAVTPPPEKAATKRMVLSQVARLFDPLGWLAPVVVQAKLIVQNAWLQQRDWDEPLGHEEAAVWHQLADGLPDLEEIRVPRWFAGFGQTDQVEVHGFSDASERAYAAVVYLRTVVAGQVHVSLVQAKTKVAPLRRITLPRLELCAASLLSTLSLHIRTTLGLLNAPTFQWSDSTVTLAWIKGHPARWTTYVANRVTEIQRDSHFVCWRHVPGRMNPADCASRGMSPRELMSHELWWRGPPFLQLQESQWPPDAPPHKEEAIPDQRPAVRMTTVAPVLEPPELTNVSSLSRLLRVTSWIRRWLPRSSTTAKSYQVAAGALDATEIDHSLMQWVKVCQSIHFAQELKDIWAGRAVRNSSALRTFTPLLGHDGVLRVGGRIRNSLLDADEKSPIILPPDSHLTRLIVEAHHRRTLHGGVQTTLASIRQRFWVLRGRQVVKRTIHHCTACIRWRAATPQPAMAALPAARVTPSRPFLHSGVDYAGPFWLRTTKGRGHRAYKGFLVIFICFSTRAVHLEVASDYSADAFLAAFRRFISRRGLCATLRSDQGSNFVGADAQLRDLLRRAGPDARRIAGRLADEGVRWMFNPPAAPNFGGLWEAAVKSVKHHLRRVIGEAKLTFEEMTTLLAEVEACLNSRPLCAMSDDPSDVSALTPGHFLIGGPLNAIPEPSTIDISPSRLTRWRLLQSMRDHLWERWATEYLTSLAPCQKWWKSAGAVHAGQLCLIRSENTPPTRWPLARITHLHPGADTEIRVVDLKTASGTLTRPVTKLVPLPCPTEAETQINGEGVPA